MPEPDQDVIDVQDDKRTALARANPFGIIQAAAADPQCDVTKLERLMDLQARYLAMQARAEWSDALAQFQATCPVVPKRRQGDKAKYPAYEDVMAVIGPTLAECGLSLSFSSDVVERGLHITCFIMHGTHTESREFTCPLPDMTNPKTGKSMVNEAQVMGMALSYAKRYALVAALNIVCVGEDFDGALPNPQTPADPGAVKAPARQDRAAPAPEPVQAIFSRWCEYQTAPLRDDMKELERAWFAWQRQLIGRAAGASDLTPDELAKLAVALDEWDEAEGGDK